MFFNLFDSQEGLRLSTPLIFLGLAFCLFSTKSFAQDSHFEVKPQRCVALHKGQSCYQKLKFDWQLEHPGHYCIVERSTQFPLQCWQQVSQALWSGVFESSENIIYQLVDRDSNRVLAELEVKVAWVYKSNKRKQSSWRLF